MAHTIVVCIVVYDNVSVCSKSHMTRFNVFSHMWTTYVLQYLCMVLVYVRTL
jgi:hypothetical protein